MKKLKLIRQKLFILIQYTQRLPAEILLNFQRLPSSTAFSSALIIIAAVIFKEYFEVLRSG